MVVAAWSSRWVISVMGSSHGQVLSMWCEVTSATQLVGGCSTSQLPHTLPTAALFATVAWIASVKHGAWIASVKHGAWIASVKHGVWIASVKHGVWIASVKHGVWIASGMLWLFGLVMLLCGLLLRSNMLSTQQSAPVFVYLVILGFLGGFLGHGAVERVGGHGGCWLFLWETLCLMHTYAAVSSSSLVRLLANRKKLVVAEGRDNYSGVNTSDSTATYFVFHALLGFVVPIAGGVMPFLINY
ncbi:hypothetical protein CYMTET_44997 [Cymbomonas tetramitiformis]|nr:hypothetical protein CYMTET_44997 [Cymbomonas tetramitiformis]